MLSRVAPTTAVSGNRAIESRQATTHPHCQPQQKHVSELPVPADERGVEDAGIPNRDGRGPEHVIAARTELTQSCHQFERAFHRSAIGRIREHSDEAVFAHRTGRPAGGPVIGEPVVRRLVMDVIGIEKSDQEVDIE